MSHVAEADRERPKARKCTQLWDISFHFPNVLIFILTAKLIQINVFYELRRIDGNITSPSPLMTFPMLNFHNVLFSFCTCVVMWYNGKIDRKL